MPEISFVALRRAVQQEYAALGHKVSSRKAEQIAGHALQSAQFKRWMDEIDQYDADRGLTDHNPHSDTTARRAIQKVIRELFDQQQKEQAAA